MWFNSIQSEKPYLDLICTCKPWDNQGILRGWYTGDAWLSSARVVRRPLKCGNERNPYRQLHVSDETALAKQGRKERTTSSQHVPYI